MDYLPIELKIYEQLTLRNGRLAGLLTLLAANLYSVCIHDG